MSFKHGKNTELWLDGADVSGYFNDLGFTAEVETAETTTFKSTWKTHLPGEVSAAVETAGLFDPTWSAAWSTIGDAPGAVLTVGPAGMAAQGDIARLITVLSTSYKETAPVGGIVGFTWGVQPDGAVGFGRVLTPLTAITADGNGTAYDGGAQTTTGGIAHLHVTSVSASDSIVVTIEDSANGASGWATIGTFASKSAAGAERIVIAGTIKRYTRAVYDVTGTGVSITVGVALART